MTRKEPEEIPVDAWLIGHTRVPFPKNPGENERIFNSRFVSGSYDDGALSRLISKETFSLAFRPAVLDHLFPDRCGVIVFDDPFTDMDAQRTAKSCELIKECAKRHQVIFLICSEDYKEMLKGKIIDILISKFHRF